MSKLKTIFLDNYQSHKSSELHFNEGINVIVGTSKSGKTAVLRGIRSITDNRPLGVVYNSYWNRDKNGKPIKEHSSSMDFGDVAVYRKKSKDFNGYVITKDGKDIELEAIGNGGAPDEVLEVLNLSSVNFQRQFDAPFLLAESPAEIGRFFNKIVNLDLSDRVLAKAEDKRKKTNTGIKESKDKIEQYTEEIKHYDWISKAKELIESIDKRQERLDRKIDNRNALDDLIVKIRSCEKELRNYPKDIDKAIAILEEIEILDKHIKDQDNYAMELDGLVNSILRNEKELEKIKVIPFEKVEKLIADIDAEVELVSKLQGEHVLLTSLICDIQDSEEDYKINENTINYLLKDFPTVCSLCGQPINKETI